MTISLRKEYEREEITEYRKVKEKIDSPANPNPSESMCERTKNRREPLVAHLFKSTCVYTHILLIV